MSPSESNPDVPGPVRNRRRSTQSQSPAPYPYPSHAQDGPRATRRTRGSQACRACRTRKTKCSNERPECRYCARAGLTCVYEETPPTAAASASQPGHDVGQQILAKLDDVLSRLDTVQASTDASATRIDHAPCCHDDCDDENHLHRDGGHRARHGGNGDGNGSTNTGTRTSPIMEVHLAADDMSMPASPLSPDKILQWSVFGGQYPPNYLLRHLYTATGPWTAAGTPPTHTTVGRDGYDNCGHGDDGGSIVNDEPQLARQAVSLTTIFLALINVKNPIVHADTVQADALEIEARGTFAWNGNDCVVLLACALATMMQPYGESIVKAPSRISGGYTSVGALRGGGGGAEGSDKMRKARRYFSMATRRLSHVASELQRAQCYFLAAVFCLFSLNPLEAWTHFMQASNLLYVHLQRRILGGRSDDNHDVRDAERASNLRQVEQCLYWSCFRSECDLRAQLPFPQSSLSHIHSPDLFQLQLPSVSLWSGSEPVDDLSMTTSPLSASAGPQGQQQRQPTSLTLRTQQQGWFFYLTELTLRRICNRIWNTFYSQDGLGNSALTVQQILDHVALYDGQLSEWYANIPGIIYHDQDDPYNLPTEELPCVIRGRMCETKAALYMPLLHYIVHHDESQGINRNVKESDGDNGSDTSQKARQLALDALEQGCRFIDQLARLHRHHGTWTSVQHGTSCALAVIAALRSGRLPVPERCYAAVRTQICILRYWEGESRPFGQARRLLEAETAAWMV